eukprot:UN10375
MKNFSPVQKLFSSNSFISLLLRSMTLPQEYGFRVEQPERIKQLRTQIGGLIHLMVASPKMKDLLVQSVRLALNDWLPIFQSKKSLSFCLAPGKSVNYD